MKKFISAMFVAMFVFTIASPTYAADIHIKVEGVTVATDVKPEVKNNRIMVPLRVISENLGATVQWSGSEVTLSKSRLNVTLKLDNSTAIINGKKVQLDVKPYIHHNRIIVPLRFIVETFGSKVDYSDATVKVDTEPLVIDGVQVTTLQEEFHMTLGGVVNQIKNDAMNEAIYNTIVDNKGSKVEAPSDYTWSMPNPGGYYKSGQYDFLDQTGNSIKQFDIYSYVSTIGSPVTAPEYLVYDATEKQWYLFNEVASRAVYQFIDTATKNGYLTVISNTIP